MFGLMQDWPLRDRSPDGTAAASPASIRTYRFLTAPVFACPSGRANFFGRSTFSLATPAQHATGQSLKAMGKWSRPAEKTASPAPEARTQASGACTLSKGRKQAQSTGQAAPP